MPDRSAVVPSYAERYNLAARYEPGTHFEYGPVPFQVFGEVMTRKLKAERRDGHAISASPHSRPDRLEGRVLANGRRAAAAAAGGEPDGPRMGKIWPVPEKRRQVEWQTARSGKKLLDELVTGSAANPAYGISFWLNREGTGPSGANLPRRAMDEISSNGVSDGAKDLFMAAGAANQRLYIIPSLDLVVVRQGQLAQYDDREFLKRLLTGMADTK